MKRKNTTKRPNDKGDLKKQKKEKKVRRYQIIPVKYNNNITTISKNTGANQNTTRY